MKKIILLTALFFSTSTYSVDNYEITKEMYSCHNIQKIYLNIDYDRIQWSPSEPFISVCLFSLRTLSDNKTELYMTRNWRSPAYCKKFKKDWDKLKKKNSTICVASYLSYPEKKLVKGKKIFESSGFWEVIKSESWCHSYFAGNCKGIPNSTESF